MNVVGQNIRRFRKDEKGVVLIIFVLIIVPLLLVIAVGIDFSQSLVVKRQLANGVDAAALAIGAQRGLINQEDLDAEAERYIKAHYPDNSIGSLKSFTATRTSNDPRLYEVRVTATAEITTSFMKIGGVDTLTVSVESTVIRQDKDLEIVMVLDNSGSMGHGNKLESMKTAAIGMINTLFGDETAPDNIRIGLVPFVGAVNVGVSSDAPWLDKAAPAQLNKQCLDLSDGQSAFTVLESMSGGVAANWGGCVRSRYRFNPDTRTGIDDLDITDTPPTVSDPDTLFSAYFYPFQNKGSDPDSPSLYEGVSSDEQNEYCPIAPIQPLTNDKTTIISAINAMTALGGTNIPEGLSWGWRVISPGEPFTEGGGYSDPGVIKAIILLTDGDNNITSRRNVFSSYGFTNGPLANPQLGSNANNTLDAKTSQVCANIKADHDLDPTDTDILLYTIVFDVKAAPIVTLMENCATTPTKHYFNSPTAADLDTAFQTIAASLNQLRIKE